MPRKFCRSRVRKEKKKKSSNRYSVPEIRFEGLRDSDMYLHVRMERKATEGNRQCPDISLDKRTTIPSVLTVIARYCVVWPRARCTGTVETKRGSLAWTNFLLVAHKRYSGKCHGFISMLEGIEREIFALRELPHTTPPIEECDN